MIIEILHTPSDGISDPTWSVVEVLGDHRRVVETHCGDPCDANERRHACERAWNTARKLARTHNTKIIKRTNS